MKAERKTKWSHSARFRINLPFVLFDNGFGDDLIVTIPENLGYEEAIDEIFNKFGIAYELRKVKTTELGSLYELVYMVTIDHLTNQKDFLDAIRCRNGNLDITLTMNPTEAAQY